MRYENEAGTLEHQEQMKHRFIYDGMVKKGEYALRFNLEGEYRRKRFYITCPKGRFEIEDYCIAFLTSEGVIYFTNEEEISQYVELDFILVNRFSALLKIKKRDEELKIFSTLGKERKLDLFSVWVVFGNETEYQLTATKFMNNQDEVFLYMKEYYEFKENNPVNRVARIVYDGILMGEKKNG